MMVQSDLTRMGRPHEGGEDVELKPECQERPVVGNLGR